eukprot:s5394_g2.t1
MGVKHLLDTTNVSKRAKLSIKNAAAGYVSKLRQLCVVLLECVLQPGTNFTSDALSCERAWPIGIASLPKVDAKHRPAAVATGDSKSPATSVGPCADVPSPTFDEISESDVTEVPHMTDPLASAKFAMHAEVAAFQRQSERTELLRRQVAALDRKFETASTDFQRLAEEAAALAASKLEASFRTEQLDWKKELQASLDTVLEQREHLASMAREAIEARFQQELAKQFKASDENLSSLRKNMDAEFEKFAEKVHCINSRIDSVHEHVEKVDHLSCERAKEAQHNVRSALVDFRMVDLRKQADISKELRFLLSRVAKGMRKLGQFAMALHGAPRAHPAELSALLAIDPGTNPADYWSARRGWDVEAIKADIRIACQPRGARPGQRDGTFSTLASAVRARSAGEGVQQRSSQEGVHHVPSAFSHPGRGQTKTGLHPQMERRELHGPQTGRKPALGSKVLPDKLPDIDNEGRPYNLKLVVVNFNNVGTSFGMIFNGDKEPKYNWEGVRRCVKELARRGFKIIGVIYQSWKGWDGEEIDWLHTLRKAEIRNWYSFSQDRIHMKYFFDSEVGFFETLDGNAARGASEEPEERRPRQARREGTRQAAATDDRICVTPPEDGDGPNSSPTITMPSANLDSSQTVDLTAELAPKRLWATKMDVNTCKAGWTPLCTAASQGKVESVKQLLMLGADPNIPNGFGAHPVFYALRNWSLRLFRLLVKHGADVRRARSERGESLQAYAERKVQQAAESRAFGAAHFSAASCQELLDKVGAQKAAKLALDAVAEAQGAAKRRKLRSNGLAKPGPSTARSPANKDPYGGNASVDLTEEEAPFAQYTTTDMQSGDEEDALDDSQLSTILGELSCPAARCSDGDPYQALQAK